MASCEENLENMANSLSNIEKILSSILLSINNSFLDQDGNIDTVISGDVNCIERDIHILRTEIEGIES
jgi:hypothetical protein